MGLIKPKKSGVIYKEFNIEDVSIVHDTGIVCYGDYNFVIMAHNDIDGAADCESLVGLMLTVNNGLSEVSAKSGTGISYTATYHDTDPPTLSVGRSADTAPTKFSVYRFDRNFSISEPVIG